MTREVRNALLVFVGAVLVLIVADGTVLHYVRPGMAPLVALAGVVLVGLALLDVVGELRGRAEGHDEHGPGRSAWLLLVPVLVVLLAAPPSLGSDAVDLAGTRTVAVARVPDEPLPAGEAPVIALVDLVARAAASPDGGALAGRDVTVTGSWCRAAPVPASTSPGSSSPAAPPTRARSDSGSTTRRAWWAPRGRTATGG